MKKYVKYFSMLILLVVGCIILAGCAPKREEVKFKGEDGTIVFNVKEEGNYKISTDKKDLRTSREQAALVGKDFKIGIEFNDTYSYFFNSDFKKLKEARKDYSEYKEVTYSNIKGIQYFYPGYMCYNILLPIEGTKEYYLELSVYGKEDNEKSAKEAIKNEEVLDVLNNITELKAVK